MRRALAADHARGAPPQSPVRATWKAMASWERSQAAERRRAQHVREVSRAAGAVSAQRRAIIHACAAPDARRGATGWTDVPGRGPSRHVAFEPSSGYDDLVGEDVRAAGEALARRGRGRDWEAEEWPPRAGPLPGPEDDESLWEPCWEGTIDTDGWAVMDMTPRERPGAASGVRGRLQPGNAGYDAGMGFVTDGRYDAGEWRANDEPPRAAGPRLAGSARGPGEWTAQAQAHAMHRGKMSPRRAAQEAAARHRQQASRSRMAYY